MQEDPEIDAGSEEAIKGTGAPDEQWWRFSDENVYAVSEADAHQSNVFMLFYERVDEPPSSPPQRAEGVSLIPLAADAPLPPTAIHEVTHDSLYDAAVELPLPEDDDLLELIPPKSAVLPAQPDAPSTSRPSDDVPALPRNDDHDTTTDDNDTDAGTQMSEAESDAPSTQLTSDNESECESLAPPTPKIVPVQPISPQLMRTAGNAAARGQGKRQSLPLVSAT